MHISSDLSPLAGGSKVIRGYFVEGGSVGMRLAVYQTGSSSLSSLPLVCPQGDLSVNNEPQSGGCQ